MVEKAFILSQFDLIESFNRLSIRRGPNDINIFFGTKGWKFQKMSSNFSLFPWSFCSIIIVSSVCSHTVSDQPPRHLNLL